MAESIAPIVVDLGKTSRKRVKRLKKGTGKLVGEVAEAVEQVRSQLGADGDGKEIVPVVVLYRKKRKKNKNAFLPFLG